MSSTVGEIMEKPDVSKKTKEQLLDELVVLRQRIIELEKVESEYASATNALRESEQRLADVQRVGKIGCFTFNLTTGLWSGTDMLYPILGIEEKREYSVEEWVEIIHPDHRDSLAKYQQSILEQKAPFDKDYLIIRQSDGETRWVHSLGELQFDDAGNAISMIGTTRDVTEAKNAEEKLRNTQKLLLKTESLAQVGSWKWDLATNKVDWSPEMYRIYQYDPVEYSEMSFSLAMARTHPDDVKSIEEFVQRAIETGKTSSIEYRIVYPDNSMRYLESEIEILEDTKGEKTHMIGYIQDITDKKLVEEALRNQNDYMNNVINSLRDTLYIFDPETGEGIQWNKVLEEISGYDYKKMKHYPPTHFYPEEEHERIQNIMKEVQEYGYGIGELTYITANGSKIPFEYSVVPVTGPDGQAWMCSIGRDLTEKKKMEAQLRRSQKMDALGKLTGGIAHDYNNMLGVILGYSGLLQEALRDDPDLSNYINEICHASERGKKLSRKLMGFSRNVQPQAEVVDVNKILITEQDMLQKTLTPRIELELNFAEDLWPIYVNSSDFEDAILNLSINAMHAMESGGKLTISTRNVQLDYRESIKYKLLAGDYVLLTVADTGKGMDAEELNNIFDPFFTTKGDKGVGLGLSMVYGFIQRSAGSITVESVKGSGSKFLLFFPRHTQLVVENPVPKRINKGTLEGSETILVVDDEAAMVNLSKKILSAKGYKVLTANGAEEALGVLEQNSVDMLLSDVIMPEVDGYQLALKVRETHPDVKILLVSGFTENKHTDKSGATYNETLLLKPFTPEKLLTQVRDILDGQPVSEDTRTILIMDDDENIQKLYEINLKKLGFKTLIAKNGDEAISIYHQALENSQTIDICILDIAIPGGVDGKEVAKRILAMDADAKLIVSSGDSYGEEMTNYRKFGFKAILEKDFNREQMMKVINEVYEVD